MDNVTHSLVGAALAPPGLKRWTSLATPTLMLGANFPDLDIVTGLFSTPIYLEYHRGITHSIIAIPILSLLLAGLMYAASQWWRRTHPDWQPAKFSPLFVLSLLSISTHPLLDFTNSYGWRPFLPWNHAWFYGDIAFVADPWLWVGLGGTLMLITASNKLRLSFWIILFLALAVPVIIYDGAGVGVKFAWFAIVALFFGLRTQLNLQQQAAQNLMRVVVLTMVAYFGSLIWLHQTAINKTQIIATQKIQAGEQLTKIDALPLPTNPFLWQTIISTDKAFYLSQLNLLAAQPEADKRYEGESGEAAAIQAALREPEIQAFRRFARFPVMEAQRNEDQTTKVKIRDVRFSGLNERATSTFQTSILLNQQLHRIVE